MMFYTISLMLVVWKDGDESGQDDCWAVVCLWLGIDNLVWAYCVGIRCIDWRSYSSILAYLSLNCPLHLFSLRTDWHPLLIASSLIGPKACLSFANITQLWINIVHNRFTITLRSSPTSLS